MASYSILHERAHAFYSVFERKGELQHQTHYCPGCGHGIAHKLIAKTIDELGIQDRTITISPVGCSVFAYYYFDTGNIQAAHGRAPAVATAVKRSRPEAVVIAYQGDGDLAAIGSAEILHAANRGENITVFFINNAIYGMTGGQMAPTTPLGAKSTTSPYGRNEFNEGYPLHVCELLASLEAPVYLERVGLGNVKQVLAASKAVRKALENQIKGLGFSLVEILSPCPTIWNLDPLAAQQRVRDDLAQVFPLGVYRDRIKDATPHPATPPPPALDALPALLDIETGVETHTAAAEADLRVRVAGFGGQGVLMLGEVLAEAGLDAGLEVSWLPSYGPEMRSGTSNCHIRVSHKPVDSPLVARPNILLALNEPSLEKFLPIVEPGGWVLYNGEHPPSGLAMRTDVHMLAVPCTQLADSLKAPRTANIVMLGALQEAASPLPDASIDHALQRLVKSEKWLDLDRRAFALGCETARKEFDHAHA